MIVDCVSLLMRPEEITEEPEFDRRKMMKARQGGRGNSQV
jgi:hypothetical protein